MFLIRILADYDAHFMHQFFGDNKSLKAFSQKCFLLGNCIFLKCVLVPRKGGAVDTQVR